MGQPINHTVDLIIAHADKTWHGGHMELELADEEEDEWPDQLRERAVDTWYERRAKVGGESCGVDGCDHGTVVYVGVTDVSEGCRG
jgi:hypothetical protein